MSKQRIEQRAQTEPPRRSWTSQLVPRTLLGYSLTVLSVVIVGVCVFAASALIRDFMRSDLSSTGAGAPGPGGTTTPEETSDSRSLANELFLSEAPGGGKALRQTRTAGGVKVTLVRAYADAHSVVVSYTLEDLRKGRSLDGHPVEPQPDSADFRLTDESGTEFKLVEEGGAVSPGPNNVQEGPLPQVAVFEAAGRIKPDSNHRFRLEVPVLKVPVAPLGEPKNVQSVETAGQTQAEQQPVKQIPEPRQIGKPFVVEFETPVRSAPVVEVDQEDTASGVTLTLEQVTDSPGQPEAVVCLKSQERMRGWIPSGRDFATDAASPVAGEGDCLEMLLSDPLNGSSSVTVAEIYDPFEREVIRGPWTFDFEVSDE